MQTEIASGRTPQSVGPAAVRIGWCRWGVCGLLFFATTINYIDRQVIGVLKPTLKVELGWSETDFGNIVFAFSAAYALGYAVGGRLMDWIGVRLGYGVAVFLWSLAAMGHAVARTVSGFSLARFGLGLAEGGNFPAAIKTVSEWFPKKERALATGIFNAGSNVGALVTPLVVPWITVWLGWPVAFVVTGCLGFFWLAVWLLVYHQPDRHPHVTAAELAYIRSDPPDPPVKIPWLELLRHRQTWAFLVGMFMTSAIGGMFIAKLAGYILDQTGNYLILFSIAASAYLVALLIIHALLPRLEPMRIGPLTGSPMAVS